MEIYSDRNLRWYNCITHALLISTARNADISYLITHKGYKLFLDETINLISPYNSVKFGDFIKAFNRKDLSIDNDNYGKVTWLNNDERDITGGFNTSTDKLKYDASFSTVYCSLRSGSIGSNDSISLVEIENEIIFTKFKRVILSTYQIKDTLFASYLFIKKINIVPFTDIVLADVSKESISDNITFITKHDDVFKGRTILSSNWYNSNTSTPASAADFRKLNSIIKDIGDKNGCKGSAYLLGFTVPSDKLGAQRDPRKIQPVGYPHTVCSVIIDSDGNSSTGEHSKALSTYIPCNARASNEYANKTVMIHAYNRYPLQPVTNYLTYHNVPFSPERFAINELVQWVWRSAIRNGQPVKLAILSSRMRSIFKEWLESTT